MDAVSLVAYSSLRWSCCCSSSWHCSCSSVMAPTIDSSFETISLSFVTCLFGAHTTIRVTSYRFPHGKCSCKSVVGAQLRPRRSDTGEDGEEGCHRPRSSATSLHNRASSSGVWLVGGVDAQGALRLDNCSVGWPLIRGESGD